SPQRGDRRRPPRWGGIQNPVGVAFTRGFTPGYEPPAPLGRKPKPDSAWLTRRRDDGNCNRSHSGKNQSAIAVLGGFTDRFAADAGGLGLSTVGIGHGGRGSWLSAVRVRRSQRGRDSQQGLGAIEGRVPVGGAGQPRARGRARRGKHFERADDGCRRGAK